VEGADAGSDRHEKGPLQELVTAWRRSSGKGPAANVVPPWDERMQAKVGAILPLPSPVVGSVLADVLVQFFSHEESK